MALLNSFKNVCLVYLILLSMDLYGQLSKHEIGQLRLHVQEAFVEDVVVLSTSLIDGFDEIPRHVLVRGYTMPSNYFVVRLPVDAWNHKLFVGGCGAGCGELPNDIRGNVKTALQRGYTTVIMNTGHWAPSKFDFSWAFNNRQAEIDYAHRSIHQTVRAAEEIIKLFYRKEAAYKYFWGCSGGGRQAVMAAARYPKDFDGVVSESPAVHFTNSMMYLVWLRQANTGADGKDILTKEDVPIIVQAVLKACDMLDGNEDGLINDPGLCSFDPESLLCAGANCLNRDKVEALKKWYRGPFGGDTSKPFVPGAAFGSEIYWGLWLLGATDEPFNELINSESMLKNMAFRQDPIDEYSVFDFDFETDPDRLEYMGSLLNPYHLSLLRFKDEGGKLLMFHGTSDPAIPYQFSVEYYEKNYAEFGEELDGFFRLFLIPGLDHCAALSTLGITKGSTDPLTALEDWVETDQVPDEMQVKRFDKEGSVRSQFAIPCFKIVKK